MIRTYVLLFCVAALALRADAQLIDFETTPSGGVPSNDLVLPSSSSYTFGALTISFGFDYNTDGMIDADAVFEHRGVDVNEPPDGGFEGAGGLPDTPAPGFAAQLGDYFLRSPVPGSDFGRLIITYAGPGGVTDASGEIWDIDGTGQLGGPPAFTEEYTVRAYDAANNLLDTQVSPLGTLLSASAPLNGKPWVFNFTGLTAGIARIDIDFTGTKPAGIGLAFNNFYPTQSLVPEPGGAALAALAALWAIAGHRRR